MVAGADSHDQDVMACATDILPSYIELDQGVVGRVQWQQKKKSKTARILRCHFKHGDNILTNNSATCQLHSRDKSDIIVKYLANDRRHTANREITVLKLLKNHHHTISYLEHFVAPNGIGIVLSPAACCDLADFLAIISLALVKNSNSSRIPSWAIFQPSTDLEIPQKQCRYENSEENKTQYRTPFKLPMAHQMTLLSSFFSCLCHALEWVHKAGLCHRDIKPENILVSNEGTVLLTDFGSAQSFEELLASSPPASVKGLKGITKKYVAPEVYQLVACHTPQSDVFSLGVVFSEMLTVLAARTLDSYEMFRLGEYYGQPYWKQPVYSRTISLVKQWLIESISIISPSKSYNEIGYSYVRIAVEITTLMVDETPTKRPNSSALAGLWSSFVPSSCTDCVIAPP